jgi:hypothetical protein
MKTLICSFLLGLMNLSFDLPFHSYNDPPCKCEVVIYKRKYSVLPCITGLLKDSATGKPMGVGALTVNGVIARANQQGQAYVEVASYQKFEVTAKVYAYYFCTKVLTINKGDSVVCMFRMRKNREPED